jgi:hypothetical protein
MSEPEPTHRESAKGQLKGAWEEGNDKYERTHILLTAIGHALLSLNEPTEAPKQRRRTGPRRVFGNSARELEAEALAFAWFIFGEGEEVSPELRVVRDYPVYAVRPDSMEEIESGGKEYFASIVVEVVE